MIVVNVYAYAWRMRSVCVAPYACRMRSHAYANVYAYACRMRSVCVDIRVLRSVCVATHTRMSTHTRGVCVAYAMRSHAYATKADAGG
jgi:hypothetical protein